MELREFERRARRVYEEIPDEYREGVDALVISREALPHPTLSDVYTLGECHTETYLSDFAGPDTTRSILVLYHGSFRRLADLDADFDWHGELWETITHELQHHLESLAAEDALEDVDYAADEHFKHLQGDPFDPFYYRAGAPVDVGIWRIEDQFFLELPYPASHTAPRAVEFEWHGRRHQVTVQPERGDLCFVWITGGLGAELGGAELGGAECGPAEGGPALALVLVRRPRLRDIVRSIFVRRPPRIVEVEASAERVPPPREESSA